MQDQHPSDFNGSGFSFLLKVSFFLSSDPKHNEPGAWGHKSSCPTSHLQSFTSVVTLSQAESPQAKMLFKRSPLTLWQEEPFLTLNTEQWHLVGIVPQAVPRGKQVLHLVGEQWTLHWIVIGTNLIQAATITTLFSWLGKVLGEFLGVVSKKMILVVKGSMRMWCNEQFRGKKDTLL